MSGLAQISATERPSAMRPQNLSAHSMLYLVGRPILAGTCVDRLLVRGGIFITSSWRRDFGNAAAFAQAMTEAALSLFSVHVFEPVLFRDDQLPKEGFVLFAHAEVAAEIPIHFSHLFHPMLPPCSSP